MKLSILSHLFMFFAFAASAAAEVPGATCLPEGEGTWPVKAIYLHGWFKAEGESDPNGFRKLELNNRKYLSNLAKLYKIRIAVPLGPKINAGNGMRQWGGSITLEQIEAEARTVCGVTNLAAPRVLFGFSNGGYKARDIGQRPCDDLKSYARIVSIGTNLNLEPRCNGKFVGIAPHVFPPANLESILNMNGI